MHVGVDGELRPRGSSQRRQWPVDFTTEAVLKSCTVVENGTDDVRVKTVMDGATLDSYSCGQGRQHGPRPLLGAGAGGRAAMQFITGDDFPSPSWTCGPTRRRRPLLS